VSSDIQKNIQLLWNPKKLSENNFLTDNIRSCVRKMYMVRSILH